MRPARAGADRSAPRDREWTPVTDLRISGGLIRVRTRACERHGLERGDVLDVWVYPDGSDPIHLPDAVLQARRRIRVPGHRVEMHDLDATNCDIEFRDTGRDYESHA